MVTKIPKPLLTHIKTMALLFDRDETKAEKHLGHQYVDGLKAAIKLGGDSLFGFELEESSGRLSEFKAKLPKGFNYDKLVLVHKRACLQALHQYFLQNPQWLSCLSPDKTQCFIEVYESFADDNPSFNAQDGLLGYILMLFNQEKSRPLNQEDYHQLACLLGALVQAITVGPYYVVVCGNEGNGMRDFTGKPYPLNFHISPALCGKKEIKEFIAFFKRSSGVEKTIFIEDGEDLPRRVTQQCYVLPLYISPHQLEEIRGGENACSLFKEEEQVMALLQINQQRLEEGGQKEHA